MAVYHRKLFPSLSNKTIEDPCLNCSDCPSVCNLFDPYEPLPPEPSFVLPPPPFSPSENNHVSALVIILAVVLASAFLIVSYYAIFVKYCSGWGSSSSRRRSNRRGEETHEDFIDGNHGLVVDHPIWFITTVGLEQSIINAISVCKYRKGEGLIEGTECSVCLNEFHEDETLRLLPKCSHAFHLPCIDTWLRSHKNCPLCRAPIVTNPNPVTVPVSGNSDFREETLGGGSESDGGLGGDSVVIDSGVRLEDEMELEDTRRDFNNITKEVVPCPPPNCGFRVLSDLADNHRAVENAIQPVRRSVSMDLSMFGSSVQTVPHSLPVQAEGSSGAQAVGGKSSNLEAVSKTPSVTPGLFRLMSSSSIGEFLQKGPVSMKRSFSSGGKLSRSSRSSVLPFCWRNRWCCSK